MNIHLRTAVALGLMGALSVPPVFPYLMAVMPAISARLAASPIPLPGVVVAQTLQAFVVLTLVSWLGLRTGDPLGLGAPWIRRALAGTARNRTPHRWARAAVIGILVGVFLVLADQFLKPMLPSALQTAPAEVARWKGLMASFYGGITEELLMRLFVMTLVVSLLGRIFGGATSGMYVTAIFISAVIFGVGHLPLAFQVWGHGFLKVFRTLFLNGVAGAVFGWLYWRLGLEHVMLAHFSADIVVHVVSPI